jgi:hypothetical protein
MQCKGILVDWEYTIVGNKQKMKYNPVIVLAFILVSCKESTQNRQVDLQKQLQAEHAQPAGEQDKDIADSAGFDEMVFGRFCKECPRDCAPMFRLNTMGNATTLWADFEDNYFKGDSALEFKTKLNNQKKLEIAFQIMGKLPRSLQEWKANPYTFGCPDCTDECGIYVEFANYPSKGGKKRFRIDRDKLDEVPPEITAYAEYVHQKIDELLK